MSSVQQLLLAGFDAINVETWLLVVPQLIARIHTNEPKVGGSCGCGSG